jgi:hypothetical protein
LTDEVALVTLPSLKAGPVVTAFRGGTNAGWRGRDRLPGEGLGVSLGAEYASLSVYGTVRPGGGGLGEPMITDYEVHMVVRRRTAMVFSLPLVSNDRPPRILWAGDLDRDGVTDLIVDAPPHYNARRYILFLSSLARGEQIVAEAASLAFVGC